MINKDDINNDFQKVPNGQQDGSANILNQDFQKLIQNEFFQQNPLVLKHVQNQLQSLVNCFQERVSIITQMIDEVIRYLENKADNKILQENKQLYFKVQLNQLMQQLVDISELKLLQEIVEKYLKSIDSIDDSEIQKLRDEQINSMVIQGMKKKSFKYELYYEKQLENDKQKKFNAFCFNKNNTFLMAACLDEIKIINLTNEFQKTTTLKQHSDTITCLQFLDKSNILISAGKDQVINIWKSWILKKTLKGHQGGVTCLISNSNEDLLISGSFDSTIKFWRLDLNWECGFTLNCHKDKVLGLSLNDSGDTLISCGDEKQIFVSQKFQAEKNSLWMAIQTIQVKDHGTRLCFLGDSHFTFQQDQSETIDIYSLLNEESKLFYQTGEVKVPKNIAFDFGFFPQKYIKQQQLLLAKNGHYVNLIKYAKNPIISEVVSIEFQSKLIFGALSNDGEILVTWDSDSGKIQLRKYVEILYFVH